MTPDERSVIATAAILDLADKFSSLVKRFTSLGHSNDEALDMASAMMRLAIDTTRAHRPTPAPDTLKMARKGAQEPRSDPREGGDTHPQER
jgi:hypothetical protein